jgi:hypothetical protein
MSNDITTNGPNGVATTSNRIAERRQLTKVAVTLFSIGSNGEEMLLARGLVDIKDYGGRPDKVREVIERGEAALAAHRPAINDLPAALVPVTPKDIAVEIGDLMLAFPGKDHLDEFVPLLFEHIMVKHPSRLVLAAACHRLRCTKKFRPAISEVLEELDEVAFQFRNIQPFVQLEANLEKARAYLVELEAERAAELAKPRFIVHYRPYGRWHKFSLIDRHDERKPVVKHLADTDAVIEFMKAADPATTECSDETKAALIEAERDAERDRDDADVFPSARRAVGTTRAAR